MTESIVFAYCLDVTSEKYVTVQSSGAEVAPELDADALAELCRQAGLLFLAGAEQGWGKRELAQWLVGPYHAISARLPDDPNKAPSSVPPSVATPVPDRSVEELVDLVRVGVSATLNELRNGDTLCVTQAIRNRTVAWARGSTGADSLLWVPVDQPRMRLEARVLSLFIVDYLLRPAPYESELTVCSSCDLVSFAPQIATNGCPRCAGASRPSHIRGLDGAPTVLKGAG